MSKARRSLDELDGCIPAERMHNVRLLASELVTNAVRHAGLGPEDSIRFRVLASVKLVRVEVHDGGPEFGIPNSGAPGPDQVGGRGLYLVQVLSDRWGVEHDDLVYVWFEMDCDG